ncbi:hypothetical protein KR200_003552, partial [Drosophila serrata]
GSVDSKMEGQFQSIKFIKGEGETLIESMLRLIGKKRLLNGTITFLEDIDDTHVGAIDIFTFKNGEWIQSNIKVRTTACDMMINYVRRYLILPNIDSNFPIAGVDCIKKGEYYVKNIQPSFEYWPTFLPQNLAKFILSYTTFEGEGLGGVELIVDMSGSLG